MAVNRFFVAGRTVILGFTEKKLTLVELRAYVAEHSTPEKLPKIKAILRRYGADKLTELMEEHYASVMAEVQKL